MPIAITSRKIQYSLVDVAKTADFILSVQKPNGEIPWSIGGKTDLWDHVESAMGLCVGGHYHAAKMAFMWTRETQLADGSWWSYYRDDCPEDGAYKDSNMIAYIATGALYFYLTTNDKAFLQFMWPTICRAIDFVVALQGEEGEIYWARKGDGSIDNNSLLTGSSSIYFSLTCAVRISSILNQEKPGWEVARLKLGEAIRNKQHVFDQTKSRFSMDWYYPILCGVITGKEATKRIEESWDKFVIEGWGIRCVSDAPWLTVGETSEVILTLGAIGDYKTAEMILSWIEDKRYDDGCFWTGVTYPDCEIYTTERTAWTSAGVLLAMDILYNLTPASGLFTHAFWKPLPFSSKRTRTS
ncbi:MAG: phenyltransferase domain-containing protein [Proteobacteria bacterium]|nr:phenyltransferase domain-containing protein [Pseudomonadota bacterium]